MLFYIRCGCSRILSINLGEYQNKKDQIMKNPKLTKKEKEIEASKLLAEYGHERYCCRTKIMGLIPYHEIVIT